MINIKIININVSFLLAPVSNLEIYKVIIIIKSIYMYIGNTIKELSKLYGHTHTHILYNSIITK